MPDLWASKAKMSKRKYVGEVIAEAETEEGGEVKKEEDEDLIKEEEDEGWIGGEEDGDSIKEEEEDEDLIKEEEEDEDLIKEEEDQPQNPPPSFGDRLSRFTFSSSSSSRAPRIIPCSRGPSSGGGTRPAREPPRPTRAKTKRPKHTGYAPPSTYAHLPPLPDNLEENLICVFIGINPGLTTARIGHSFANPTNLFWRLMHSSGCTPDRRLPPQMDVKLPELYSLGQTNIVKRPTKDTAELSKEELLAGVAVLEEKMQRYKPEAVCFVGKVVWEAVFKVRNGRGIRKGEFDWGWQEGIRFGKKAEDGEGESEGKWEGCKVFVVPSTSGLVAAYSPEFKRNLWKRLGDWVQMRRRERGENAPKVPELAGGSGGGGFIVLIER